MKSKSISMKTIASDLGISTTTVSFVLNGKAREKHISDELTQKVEDYAKKVNYKPNPIAQSLRTGKSNTLALMVEDISNDFFAKLARIIEEVAYDKGYKVVFCSHENNDKKFEELINYFRFRLVDGFIIVPSPGVRNTVERLIEENVPVVLVDRYFENLACNAVVIDNKEAAKTAGKHLIEAGFKNIAFITVNMQQTQMNDRLQGYEEAIAEAGLRRLILRIPFEAAREIQGKRLIYEFVANHPEIDAIFFSTNYLTQSGLEIFNIKDPDFISRIGLVAFDDNNFFKICNPSITAVAQPLQDIGSETMRLMAALLKRKNVKEASRKVVLSADLVVRQSSSYILHRFS